MRRALRWAGLLTLAVFVFPALAADEKAKDEKKPAPVEKKDEKKATAGEKKPTAKAKANAKDAVIVYLKPIGRLSKLDDPKKIGLIIQEPYLEGRDIKYRDKEIELPRAEELTVRLGYTPVQFDDKGKRRRLTKQELDEMRGPDKRLPGYQADVDNLKNGQTVQVFLTKKKSAPRTEPAAITLIIILREPQ